MVLGKISRQRAIIDRRKLTAKIDGIVANARSVHDARPVLIECWRDALEEGRAEICLRFLEQGATGTATVRATAFLFDQLLRLVHMIATEYAYPMANPSVEEGLAVVAVGGYGRGELAPHSDIDLLFLTPHNETHRGEQVVEYMLYVLWDLGLKVGHSTRSVDECLRQARRDLTVRTALLEARYVWGNQALFGELRKRFFSKSSMGSGLSFVKAKLAERNSRHKRMGDSRYLVEPNIKDGKGGLRDLQTLFWIGKYLYRVNDVSQLVVHGILSHNEARSFSCTQDFLWHVRCHLHYLTERAEERLTFDLQPLVAAHMGFTDRKGVRGIEHFMTQYYQVAKEVGGLTRIFTAIIEDEHRKRALIQLPRKISKIDGCRVDGGRLGVTRSSQFKRDPVAMLRLFRTSQQHDLAIDAHTLRLVTRNLDLIDGKLRRSREANRLFVEILSTIEGPDDTLRRMNETGLLGKFIPDFGRVVGQMQHDMYHVYTVDEHTIFAIGILNRIDRGMLKETHPLSSDIIHRLQSRCALYLAVLCHDLAKGRDGDHSVIGAKVAERLARRLGFSTEETETVSWLVLHHLDMSRTAFRRDLSDPKTIRDFVDLVQSPERLRLLLCLTVCDIRAVGPDVWNGWKATLLRELYWAAEDMMSGGAFALNRDKRVHAAKEALVASLTDWPVDQVTTHLARGYPGYWLAHDTAILVRHAHLVRAAEERGQALAIDTRVDRPRSVTEITIYTQDHPGLFSRISGALAAAGANVVDARIFTTHQGSALDTFTVQDMSGGAFADPHKLVRLEQKVESALAGRFNMDRAISQRPVGPPRTQIFTYAPRVIINNNASRTHTVIEVNGRDRPGLLYDVTRALRELNLSISTAKIDTYGERAVDVFYVRDAFGKKLEDDARLIRVRQGLMSALGSENGKIEQLRLEEMTVE